MLTLELLHNLEWSGRTQGQGTSMGANNGAWYNSCPICRGLKGKPNEFREEAHGHKADCALAQAIRRLTRVEHSDDRAADRFGAAMKDKLAFSRGMGRGGWEDKEACSQADLSRMLYEHVTKGDPVDVANFCMMLHERGERILMGVAGPKQPETFFVLNGLVNGEEGVKALTAGGPGTGRQAVRPQGRD